MSRRISIRIVAVLAVLALLMPVTAGVASAKESNVVKTDVLLLNPATLNGLQLKPGTYSLVADGSKLTLRQNGKVVAMAPITWKDDSAKSASTTVVVSDNAVQEIHFSGKTKYVAIAR